jgi:hypothetical protein
MARATARSFAEQTIGGNLSNISLSIKNYTIFQPTPGSAAANLCNLTSWWISFAELAAKADSVRVN